ncbi:MAG: prolyl oligopeptidase family serine peptidase, partial [Nitrospirae bacterium]|nr:prolyl oligopeptidase family serine peptidase [Nitrospirota bacterium]
MSGSNVQPSPQPPQPQKVPVQLKTHDHVRIDPYFWMNDRENPAVLQHLHDENAYVDAMMAHAKGFEESLFEEIKGRIKQTDLSVPFKLDDYFYYTRFEEGKEYPIFCRKKLSLDNPEEIMLDVNVLAEGHEYYAVGACTVSFNQDILAYAFDSQGRRIYTIRFKNLITGEVYEDEIPDVTGNMAWANDNRTLLYSRQDPTTLRSHQIKRHSLGHPPEDDHLVFQEEDETFSVYVIKTKSKRFLMIASQQTVSSEYQYVDANTPFHEFKVFLSRERDHEYDMDHFGDAFYIRTNDHAKNFRLMKTSIDQPDRQHWQEVIPHRSDVLLESFELFNEFYVLEERKEGLINLRVISWDGDTDYHLDFGEPTYLASLGENPEFHTTTLRYIYTSMTTPTTVYDYDMQTRAKTFLKQEEVLGEFNSANYQTDRVWATAPDGTSIPISLVSRKGFERNGEAPLLLYGYGSYGASMDASFSSPRLSLLDRGFMFALAHIRGGEEMGRYWYEDGKLLNKKNTFTDFIACAEFLLQEQYTKTEKLFAMG